MHPDNIAPISDKHGRYITLNDAVEYKTQSGAPKHGRVIKLALTLSGFKPRRYLVIETLRPHWYGNVPWVRKVCLKKFDNITRITHNELPEPVREVFVKHGGPCNL